MSPDKQRRYLIWFTVACFCMWIVASFMHMTLWLARGGLPKPTEDSLSLALCLSFWESCRHFVFSTAPGMGAGYLFLGLFMLRFLAQTKDKR